MSSSTKQLLPDAISERETGDRKENLTAAQENAHDYLASFYTVRCQGSSWKSTAN